jgi:LPXTG-motif cell wall-anchored protein
VVATEADTEVTINGSTISAQALQAGQVYFHRDSARANQTGLTGMLIESDKPVAVFSGNERTRSEPSSLCCTDHVVQQLAPTTAWGTDFIALRYARNGVTGDEFRIVADQDDTVITVDGSAVATLSAGGYYNARLFPRESTSAPMVVGGSISATKPVQVAQFLQVGDYYSFANIGDPAMSLIPPAGQFLDRYVISTLVTGFDFNSVNVVIPTSGVDSFRLNGATVAAGSFVEVAAEWSAAQLRLEQEGTYTLTSDAEFGIFMYGGRPADGYATYGGTATRDLANPPQQETEQTPPPPSPPPASTTPTTTTTTTTVPLPRAPVPRPEGSLPALQAGESLLLVDGQPARVVIEIVDDSVLQVRGEDFVMSLLGTDENGQASRLTPDGRLRLQTGRFARVAGEGFLPGTEVDVWLFSTPIYLGALLVGSDGSFDGLLPIGEDVVAGDHTLQANGFSFDSVQRSLSLPVFIEVDGPELPTTGGNPNGLLTWALLGLALGGILVVGRRPRPA